MPPETHHNVNLEQRSDPELAQHASDLKSDFSSTGSLELALRQLNGVALDSYHKFPTWISSNDPFHFEEVMGGSPGQSRDDEKHHLDRASLALEKIDEVFLVTEAHSRQDTHEVQNPKPVPPEKRAVILDLLRNLFYAESLKRTDTSSSSSHSSSVPSLTWSSSVFSASSGESISYDSNVRFHLTPALRARKAVLRKLGACPRACRQRKIRCALHHHNLRSLIDGTHTPQDEALVDWAIRFDAQRPISAVPTQIANVLPEFQYPTLDLGRQVNVIVDRVDQAFGLPSSKEPFPYEEIVSESWSSQNYEDPTSSVVPRLSPDPSKSPSPKIEMVIEQSDKQSIDNRDDRCRYILDETLNPLQHATMGTIMSQFWLKFQDLFSNLKSHAGSSSASSSNSNSRKQYASSSTTSISTKVNRKRVKNNDENPPGDDGEEDEGQVPKRPRKNGKAQTGRIRELDFACPYRKYNPRTFSLSDHIICATGHWQSISRLKEHLYRIHKQNPECRRCRRCWEQFYTEELLEAHTRLPESCELQPSNPLYEFDVKVENLLRSRKNEGRCEEEQWYHIYRLIFPHAQTPVSPYFDPIPDCLVINPNLHMPVNLADYNSFIERELPRRFIASVIPIIESEFQPLRDRLYSMTQQLFQTVLEKTIADYAAAQGLPMEDMPWKKESESCGNMQPNSQPVIKQLDTSALNMASNSSTVGTASSLHPILKSLNSQISPSLALRSFEPLQNRQSSDSLPVTEERRLHGLGATTNDYLSYHQDKPGSDSIQSGTVPISNQPNASIPDVYGQKYLTTRYDQMLYIGEWEESTFASLSGYKCASTIPDKCDYFSYRIADLTAHFRTEHFHFLELSDPLRIECLNCHRFHTHEVENCVRCSWLRPVSRVYGLCGPVMYLEPQANELPPTLGAPDGEESDFHSAHLDTNKGKDV